MELVVCTDEQLVFLDHWIKRNGYGIVIEHDGNKIPMNCGIKQCIQEIASLFIGNTDYVLSVVDYADKNGIKGGMEVYYSKNSMVSLFALFCAGYRSL